MEHTVMVEDEIARARKAFDSGRTHSIRWRHDQLDGMVSMLSSEEDAFLDAMYTDSRKPRFEAWATDVGVLVTEIRYIRKHLEAHLRSRRVAVPLFMKPGSAEVRLEPLGVVLVMSPWNYPLNLAVAPMAAAVAAGNAVVVKPSEISSATSKVIAAAVPRYLDPEAVRVVNGGPDVATELLRHRFDHIFFTGSTRVARIVMEAAAVHLTPVTLELGGKSPAIVDRSADLAITARRIAQGKLINAGQTCIAPDYVLVPEAIRDDLVGHLVKAFDRMTKGDAQNGGHYARIVTDGHHQRLVGMLQNEGTMMGGRADALDRFLEPTIVVDPELDSPLMRDEIFGPVLAVITVEDVDAAIAFVNARPRPLILYVFSDDDAATERVIRRTSSGGVGVNQTMYNAAIPGLPFGGVGESGIGRYRGLAGVDRLSNHRGVLKRPLKPDLRLAYPPFGPIGQRILRRLI